MVARMMTWMRGKCFWLPPVVIALLCCGALAVLWLKSLYLNVQERSVRSSALAQARSIHMALSEYSYDEDGRFPTGFRDSNEALRKLMSRKFQDERIFHVRGSAWHNTLPEGQVGPDNDVGEAPLYLKGLEQGENHWAYASGIHIGSKGNLPLLMDGFSETPGVYAGRSEEKGGRWEGMAIVVRADGSGRILKLENDFRVYEEVEGRRVDIFSNEYGTDPAVLLNPW